MKCLFCIQELPVDGNHKHITCPKCGSEFYVTGHYRLVETEDPDYYEQPTENNSTEQNPVV